MSDLLPLSSPLRRTPSGFSASLDTPALAAMCLTFREDSSSAALPPLDPKRASATVVDYATSQRLAVTLDAHERYAYDNALCALYRLPNAIYVEGVVVLHDGLQLDHAWLDTDAGVIDPTPSYAEAANGACTYFAGPRWTLSEMLPLFAPENQHHHVTPMLSQDFVPSPRREAWIRAKLAAFRHASALHQMRSGHPAITADEHEATLQALLGSHWARRVLEGCCADAGQPPQPV